MTYKRKVSIRFYTTKHGRRRAQYWVGMRWLPLAVNIAAVMLANGDAKLVEPDGPAMLAKTG